jgi:hypothetical protein
MVSGLSVVERRERERERESDREREREKEESASWPMYRCTLSVP